MPVLTPEQVSRATAAVAGVFSPRCGMTAAFEAARNVAQALLAEAAIADEGAGVATPVADLIAEFLTARRALWPNRWEGALTDEGIADLAARGGAAWTRTTRAARAA